MSTQVEREKAAGFQRLTILLKQEDLMNLKILAAQKKTTMSDLARIVIAKFVRGVKE